MSDIPLKPVTHKTINRFPALYKLQAQQAIRYEVREAISTTVDTIVMGSILSLIEEFGFGTNKQATLIPRFLERLQSIVDTSSEYYDEAVAIGLRNRLHGYGIEYKQRNEVT